MTDVLDPASLIEAAQDAAAKGDFSAAERLLREAADAQEKALGSEHPDLASTLNNLAFVCERTNNLADAERCYRRAHAIAVASLSPRHPFVATSIKNLVDFCAAHDIPIWKPTERADDETRVPDVEDAEVASDIAQNEISIRGDTGRVPPSRSALQRPGHAAPIYWMSARTITLAALGVVVIAVVVFAMRSRETAPPIESHAPVATTSAPTPDPAVTSSVETTKRDAAPATPQLATAPKAPPNRERRERPHEHEAPPHRAEGATSTITVLNAQLCTRLGRRGSPDWQCSSASGELTPGTYSFYTRLLTSASTTVEHRWLRDGRVHQTMRLRIAANAHGGYRTFSTNSISTERAGAWTVELRAADGTLLHEERFVVR